jgi:hypothetical protein
VVRVVLVAVGTPRDLGEIAPVAPTTELWLGTIVTPGTPRTPGGSLTPVTWWDITLRLPTIER